MAAGGASPSSSPRLPSPPPIAEDQLGPKSPVATLSNEQGVFNIEDTISPGAVRRIRPGTKTADIPEGPPLVEIAELDSSLQLNDYLKALYNDAIHPKDSDHSIPIDRKTAIRLATPPKDVDRAIWLYELCRFLCEKVNSIIIALFADNPPCSSVTCNEMRASEWQYLCAVHDPPKPCCAIDYCCHTLDWAANVLTSPKHFPSRLSLGHGSDHGPSHQQMRQLTNIFRRVYRIFAHAWFQHREMFWQVEGQRGLYVFFKTVCDVYGLIPEDNYTIPPEAEGAEPSSKAPESQPVSILQRTKDEAPKTSTDDSPIVQTEPQKSPANLSINTGHTTKRHRQTPSMSGESITTVLEENEDDEQKQDQLATKGNLTIEKSSEGDNNTPDTAVPKDEPTPVVSQKPELPSNDSKAEQEPLQAEQPDIQVEETEKAVSPKEEAATETIPEDDFKEEPSQTDTGEESKTAVEEPSEPETVGIDIPKPEEQGSALAEAETKDLGSEAVADEPISEKSTQPQDPAKHDDRPNGQDAGVKEASSEKPEAEVKVTAAAAEASSDTK